MKKLIFGALFGSIAFSAAAADVTTERTVSVGIAQELVAAAVAAYAADGYNVVAVVVDRSGVMKALLRADNSRPHAIEIAERKAHTAALLGYETARLDANIKKGATPDSLLLTEKFTSLLGGFPIKSGKEVIGGIGVSGAPGGHLDKACVEAAMKTVEGRVTN